MKPEFFTTIICDSTRDWKPFPVPKESVKVTPTVEELERTTNLPRVVKPSEVLKDNERFWKGNDTPRNGSDETTDSRSKKLSLSQRHKIFWDRLLYGEAAAR